jgi:hypothetical protein
MDGKTKTSRGPTALGDRYLFLEIEKDCGVARPMRITELSGPAKA